MALLDLTADELLTTTRSVRKRLDFARPVEAELIRECLEIAVQAPTGGNRQTWTIQHEAASALSFCLPRRA